MELELTICKYFNIEPIKIKYYPLSLFNEMVTFVSDIINERKIKKFQEDAQRQLRGR